MIIADPRTHLSYVVDNTKHRCTEINENGKIYHNNYHIFTQRQNCQNIHQEEFWNNIDLQKAEEQLYELILSFHLSGIYHNWVKLLEGLNQAPRRLQFQHINTADTMNITVWNRIQSTPIFAAFFGCFSRHRPVTRNKGWYHSYNSCIGPFHYCISRKIYIMSMWMDNLVSYPHTLLRSRCVKH